MRFKALLGVMALALVMAAPAQGQTSRFGEIFPDLPALNSQTNQQLADLAQLQLDPNLDSENNCTVTTPPVSGCVFTGFTYLGQFLDHDLTLDTSPSPTAPVDFTQLVNNRTFALDLDSLYGGGPAAAPQLYEADGKHFRLQEANVNGVRDLPRGPETIAQGGPLAGSPVATAVLVEARNDENQILAQLHTAFLRAHNVLVDQGLTFAQAKQKLTLHYQRMVLDDYLPHVLSMPMGQAAATLLVRQPRAALRLASGMTPIEFSVASFRFGHSQVRRAYRLNSGPLGNCPNTQVFNLANMIDSLAGGRNIQAGRQIDWGQFFEEFPEPAGCEGLRNIGRKVDTLISSSLFQLPIPGAEAAGDNVLGFRNMVRAKFYDMPSGQSVARALRLPVLTDAELGLDPVADPELAAAFANGVPLWYYLLAESSVRQGGQRLGPVGSILNGATFAAVLLRDSNSILRRNAFFRPDPAIAGPDRTMQMADLLRLAGVAP